MILRAIQESDIPIVQAIHTKFYAEEFDLPDFKTNTLCAFVIEEDEKIICAVDLHKILEATLITDKSTSFWARKRALHQVLQMCRVSAKSNNYHQIHAFVQEKVWKKFLLKFGFANCKGNAMVISSGIDLEGRV